GVSQGLRVGLVDADVGQSQIGPPTTIGLKILSHNPEWDLLEADNLHFVGWISPEGHLLQCVTGVRLMVDAALKAGVNFVVVDTTGYVKSIGAIALKQHKIEIIQPRHLVCIQHSGELDAIVSGFDVSHPIKVHRLSPHQAATSKTSKYRREYRESRVNRYFSETVEALLPFDQFRGRGTPFFAGRRANGKELDLLSDLANTRVLYGEWGHRTLTLISRSDLSEYGRSQIKSRLSLTYLVARTPEYFDGRFVGLVDGNGKMVSVGIIQTADFETNHFKVRCKPGATDKTKIVQFGRYKHKCVRWRND
ncbi:MAG: Clp1/GlmU family protein, partial [Candidatus Poribacteria bacterium]|nr:Clp1/GlmU family protein [Candidatus Poribacteria bacterium]